ncbi:Arrestin domain containing [Seminavis robusta]|uniref:Arrestin domain containing n=1 Tax=Seminavis robusta TaxID=568900 RepID=A0A9N8HYT9_9STRA|nr:Arrestin domain containing [Seminavis robusta]|eukprot:Sro2080_g313740.1 Arrestin domain containing (523) ;mRNA; f:10126-11824
MGNQVGTMEIQLEGERPGGREKYFQAGSDIRGRIVAKMNSQTAMHFQGNLKLHFFGEELAIIGSGNITGAPSSFEERQIGLGSEYQSRNGCSITYYLRVLQDGKILSQRTVVGRGSPKPQELIPARISPQLHHVSGFFGLKGGSLRITARIPDVHIGRGKALQVFIACTNRSGVTIQSVQIKLKEVVSWRAPPHVLSENRAREKKVKITRLHINDIDLPGIQKQSRNSMPSLDIIDEIYQLLQKEENREIVMVPKGCRESYKRGKVVTVSHYLSITFVCAGKNAKIKIPVTVADEMQPGHLNPPHTPPTDIVTVAPSRNSPTVAASAPPTVVATAISAGQQGTSSLNILQATAVPSTPRASAPPALATALSTESIDFDVPLAQVLLIPSDTDSFRAPSVTAPLTAMRLGGDVIVLENYSSDADSQDGDFVAEESSPDVSWEGLRRELHRSLEDYTLLVQKATDPQWIPFLASLTPEQYATVILLTDVEPDQIKVAELLARHIKTHNPNRCLHVSTQLQVSKV